MTEDWTSQEAAAWPTPSARTLPSLPRKHRPREKAFAQGVAALGTTELVALILGNGTAAHPALKTAARLTRKHGVRGLRGLSLADWTQEGGIGPALAARLAAAFELGRRGYGDAEIESRATITRPKDAWTLTRELGRARKEHLVGLYLDAQNGLIHRETISVGSLNTTRSHPREILYPAIAHLALGFLLVHNHPSGSLDPSDEDVAFTRAVHRAGETLGIELYDHLIVTRTGFTSLRERGAF
jgi:DNA repair protein RadC